MNFYRDGQYKQAKLEHNLSPKYHKIKFKCYIPEIETLDIFGLGIWLSGDIWKDWIKCTTT